ncbi:MAG TPA: F0F1 ATP synthase subunit A [Gammaproteobacteria bacterium]
MSSEAQDVTLDQYIHHHLTYWTVGEGFWAINVDTLLFSFGLGALFLITFILTARRATTGVPGKWQAFVEIVVEKLHDQVKSVFSYDNPMIAPMAITIFVWVWLMNFMDMLPVDALPWVAQHIGAAAGKDPEQVYLKIVPTNDLNLTFGMSLTIFLMTMYYSVAKGPFRYVKFLFSHPFEAHGWVGRMLVALPNLLMNIVETFAKPLSLSLRLFGNLFAGEILYVLIAVLPWWINWLPGFGWTVFHLIVITVQAFVFMMLSVVYLNMAHQIHDSNSHH